MSIGDLLASGRCRPGSVEPPAASGRRAPSSALEIDQRRAGPRG